jgi:transposase
LQAISDALNSWHQGEWRATLRGDTDSQLPLFHVFEVEDRIRPDHPLRDIKRRTDRLLATLNPQFEAAYSHTGRPSVPPERLLKALLLMALYSIRSERQLCEQIDVNLLYRWFLDMQPSEDAFDATAFTKNRPRLDEHGLAKAFFDAVVAEALTQNLCSEHFSVDGTLIESLASAKSFQPKDAADDGPQDAADDGPQDANGFKPRNTEVDFHGQQRTNETHQSPIDPEAKLYRKGRGKEAKLAHMGHAISENRNGLIISITATEANGTAERDAAIEMLADVEATHGQKPATLGADKGFDDGGFFRVLEMAGVEPHIPLVKDPVDPKTVNDPKRVPDIKARRRMKRRMKTTAYQLSQKCRKKVEEGFGWLKTVAGLDRCRTVGRWKLKQLLQIGAAAYNLVRMRSLKAV